MAKKKSKKSKSASNNSNGGAGSSQNGLWVDPARVRFQHARIRPFFSGCGRTVMGTLEELRSGKIKPSDLPPIQVLVGPVDEETGQPWYFSLNNRRLWVLKRCREEGLLENNQIYVRVRKPKSEQEAARYTIENCAVEAKIMPEKSKTEKENVTTDVDPVIASSGLDKIDVDNSKAERRGEDVELKVVESDDDSESSDEQVGPSNRFSALF